MSDFTVWKLVPVNPSAGLISQGLRDEEGFNKFGIPEEAAGELYARMVEASPQIAANVMLDEKHFARRLEIMAGQNLPGLEGCLLRLLAVSDFENARAWVNGEIVRKTSPSDRMQVALTAASFILTQAILSVKEHGHATKDVLNMLPQAVHESIWKAKEAAKADRAPALRVVPKEK